MPGLMLKEERQQRVLELLAGSHRVVTSELPGVLGVSADTVRRDLDQLPEAGHPRPVRGGARARSPVSRSYEGRREQAIAGKCQTARAAVSLLAPGQVVILDGGSTALALAEMIPPSHTGTFITHSPPIAAALGPHPGLEVVVVGGVLDRRAMVATGAQTVDARRASNRDGAFLGIWSLDAEHGISEGYAEEAEVRRGLLERADRGVGWAWREKH